MSIYVSKLDISFAHFTHTDDLNNGFVEHPALTNCVLSVFLVVNLQ